MTKYEFGVLLPSALADGLKENNNIYRALAPISQAGAKARKNESSVFYPSAKADGNKIFNL
jgi:hypothetical protein